MNILFLPEAEEALFEITLMNEENEAGSGEIFINDFLQRLSSFTIKGFDYAICPYPPLESMKFQSIAIDDWVIAFLQQDEDFVVHYILYQPGLR
jgi:hypothetical protein